MRVPNNGKTYQAYSKTSVSVRYDNQSIELDGAKKIGVMKCITDTSGESPSLSPVKIGSIKFVLFFL